MNVSVPNEKACIYCFKTGLLEDEHVMPFGLGGRTVFKKASCRACATETGRLEQRLLRGQWWPYREYIGIATRSGSYPKYRPAYVLPIVGEKLPVQVLTDEVPFVVLFDFDSPSILLGQLRTESPAAKQAFMIQIKEGPKRVLENGRMRDLLPWEKVEYPINFDSHDVLRFIAKVAHSYALHKRGPSACTEYFLPSIILGKTDGALSYVGGCSTELLKPKLPGKELHELYEREVNGYLVVNIQLFCNVGIEQPIFEAVVGRI